MLLFGACDSQNILYYYMLRYTGDYMLSNVSHVHVRAL
jgi:hypothetical protein